MGGQRCGNTLKKFDLKYILAIVKFVGDAAVFQNVTTYIGSFESIFCRQDSVLCIFEGIMSEQTEFDRGQIVGARMVAAIGSKVRDVYGALLGTISKIIAAYTGKTGKGILKTPVEKVLRLD